MNVLSAHDTVFSNDDLISIDGATNSAIDVNNAVCDNAAVHAALAHIHHLGFDIAIDMSTVQDEHTVNNDVTHDSAANLDVATGLEIAI